MRCGLPVCQTMLQIPATMMSRPMQRPPMLKPRPNFSDLRGEGVLRGAGRGAAEFRRAGELLAFHEDGRTILSYTSKRGTGRKYSTGAYMSALGSSLV